MTSSNGARSVELAQGPISYRDEGSGEPLLFVHGFGVDGELWREVVPLLRDRFRCIVPDLPLGSHKVPMRPDADLSPNGMARLVDDLMAALDLDGVTLVGNDTGGAVCQLVAANHPDRIARLILTNCDAYQDFPPLAFRYLVWAAKVPGAMTVLMQTMRPPVMRRAPIAYGMLTKRRLPDDLLERWARPGISSGEIRRDAGKLLREADKRLLVDTAERLRSFDKPGLLAWAPEDRFFKVANGKRLASDLPNARLELIDDSSTFVSLDQPQRLAELVAAFMAETAPAPAERA